MMFTGFWLTSLTTLIDIFDCRTPLYISYPSPFLLSILLNVKNISHPMKHKLSADLYAHLLLCFLKHITLFPMLRSQHLVAVGFGVWAKTYHPDLVWCGMVTDNPLEHLQCCSRLLTELSVLFPYPLHCLGWGSLTPLLTLYLESAGLFTPGDKSSSYFAQPLRIYYSMQTGRKVGTETLYLGNPPDLMT